MHGVIFVELKKFLEATLGAGAWKPLLAGAGLPNRLYLPLGAYPDEEMVALVAHASRSTGLPVRELLRGYGEFIAPHLLQMYRAFLNPEWKTLDIIEHTEEQVHTRVRVREEGAAPPYLEATRVSPTEVLVRYTSERKLCAMAEGVALGVAKHFGETIDVMQTHCMHLGAGACEIQIQLR